MWKPICTDTGVYLLKYDIKPKNVTLHLSDLTYFWVKEIPENLIITKFKKDNPTLSIKKEDVTNEILSLFDNIDNSVIKIEKQDTAVIMKISNIMNLPDSKLEKVLNIEFENGLQEKFTEMLTVPMIQTIYFLEKQQEMLCKLLKKKDLELEQYRLEKELISRTDLITEKFNENTVKTSSGKLILNVFSRADQVMEKLSQQFGEIQEKVESVSLEPWNQIKKKRKILNSNTAAKKKRNEIMYKS